MILNYINMDDTVRDLGRCSNRETICMCDFCRGVMRDDVMHLKLFAPNGKEYFLQIDTTLHRLQIKEKL